MRRRHAADQQRRRHHELRDARLGPAAARLRLDRWSAASSWSGARRQGEELTTLDDVDRALDADMLVIADADGPTSIAGIMGGERSEVPDEHQARPDGGRDLERAEHPAHLGRLALRSEASRPLREGPAARAGHARPGPGHDPHARADRRASRRRHDRRGRPGPRPDHAAAARRAHRAAARHRGPARRGGHDPARARVRGRRSRRRARRHGPRLPPRGRHARGRPRRGGRAAVGAREAPGHAALAPRRHRRALPGPAAAPPRRGRARGRRAVGGARLELRRARPRRAAADPGRRHPVRPRGHPQPDVRGAVGPAHDAARVAARRRQANRARGMGDVRLFEIGAAYLDRPRPGETRGELPDERTHIAALLTGALRSGSWRENDPPRADLYSAKAVLAALLDTLRVPWRVEPPRAVPDPGRAARVLVGDEPAGWLGEIHSASRATGTSRTPPGSSSSWPCSSGRRRPCRATST